MNIRVILTGRSYHFAEQLPETLELADGSPLQTAIDALNELLPDEGSLPPSCIIALNNEQVGTIGNHSNPALKDGAELLFVTPVAGG